MEDTLIALEEIDYSPEQIKDLKEAAKEQASQAKSKSKKKAVEEELPEFIIAKTPEELRLMGREQRKRYYEWRRQRDREMVKGTFINYEMPGNDMSFSIRLWDGDPLETYTLLDGQSYSLPRGVARHLNTSGWYPAYEYVPGGKYINVPGERPTNMRVGKKIRRYSFQIMDSIEDAEYGESSVPGLVSVEYIGSKNLTK